MATAVGSGREFVRAAMRAPYLERTEEQALARRWREQSDDAALHRLTLAHMRLAISVAARFRAFGLPMGDLIQEAHVGLLEAAARFEPEREVRFSTYATWWIRAAIQDYILRNWSIVRGGTSSAQKALFFNLRRLRARLARDDRATTPTIHAEIAVALGVPRREVALMDWRLSAPDMSLNAPVGDGDNAGRQEFLVDGVPLPDETVGTRIDVERRRSWLGRALRVLSERELSIVRARRLTEDAATLEELGTRLGISKERVRQIEHRALEKLRGALLREQPDRTAFV